MQTIPDRPTVEQDHEIVSIDTAETIHTVLSAQARGRTTLELWAGTLVGGANAALIWTRFPSLHWLAAGFAATACYGIWGLADRKLANLSESIDNKALSRILMLVSRVAAGTLGWACALFAVLAFLTAGIATMGFPGG